MHVVTHPNHPKTKYQTRIRELITKAEQVQTKFIADYQKKKNLDSFVFCWDPN